MPYRSSRINLSVTILLAAVVMFLFALPVFLRSFYIYLFSGIFIMTLFAYGFHLLFTYAGYISFGHAAFYAVGAYTVALMYKHVSDSVWLAFLMALATSAFIGAIIGALSVRLNKIYFAFLTLGFGQLVYTVIFRWRSFTGGDDGIPGVMRGTLDFGFFQLSLRPLVNYYYFTLVIFLLCIFVLWRIVNSPFGYTLMSIRDNQERSSFTGVNVLKYAWLAFVISSMVTGLAGALMVSLCGIAYPELSFWSSSADPILATLIGGAFTFSGPFVGSACYVLMKSYLMSTIGNWAIALGLILLVLVLFFRSGIMGFFSQRFKVML
jgi:branched-chain amino acid transport system permease protein